MGLNYEFGLSTFKSIDSKKIIINYLTLNLVCNRLLRLTPSTLYLCAMLSRMILDNLKFCWCKHLLNGQSYKYQNSLEII